MLLHLELMLSQLTQRIRRAKDDDRGELNSSVAWAGLMLIGAVTVGGIVVAATTGAASRFDFGF